MKKKSRRPLKKPFWRLRKKVSEQEGEPSGTPAVDARENAVETARTYFASKNNPESNRRSARAFMMGAAQAAVVIPILLYLQLGVIDSFSLSLDRKRTRLISSQAVISS